MGSRDGKSAQADRIAKRLIKIMPHKNRASKIIFNIHISRTMKKQITNVANVYPNKRKDSTSEKSKNSLFIWNLIKIEKRTDTTKIQKTRNTKSSIL